MLVSDVPCSFLKELVEEYPKDIKSYEEWFSFLNRMEVRVRSVSSEKPVVTLLRIYECALNCLDADWTNRIYVIIFYRRAVLASHEDWESGSMYLSLCSINARLNAALITAVAYQYCMHGEKSRARSLLESTRKKVDSSELRDAERILNGNGDMKSCLGAFYYRPVMEINEIDFSQLSSSGISSNTDYSSQNDFRGNGECHQHLGDNQSEPDRKRSDDMTVRNLLELIQSDKHNKDLSVNSQSNLPLKPSEGSSTTSAETFGQTELLEQPELSTILDILKVRPSWGKNGVTDEESSPSIVQKNQENNENSIVVNGISYKVIGVLGHGGSSAVYWALDSSLQSWAIKKVNLKNASPEVVAAYMNEIQMLKCFADCDRIIRLHNHERTEKALILVMEKGDCDFRKVIHLLRSRDNNSASDASDTSMPSSAVVFYWEQMLRCVKALHDRRVVHLDLKPQNFVVVCGQLKLIDLGISHQLLDDSTTIQQWLKLGTLSFMSPEQLESASSSCNLNQSSFCGRQDNQENLFKVGRKSDIWSLGVILYLMVYGKSPFNQSTLQSLLSAIINPNVNISLPPISNMGIYKALERSLVRNYLERATVDELLSYEYVRSICTNH